MTLSLESKDMKGTGIIYQVDVLLENTKLDLYYINLPDCCNCSNHERCNQSPSFYLGKVGLRSSQTRHKFVDNYLLLIIKKHGV